MYVFPTYWAKRVKKNNDNTKNNNNIKYPIENLDMTKYIHSFNKNNNCLL